MAEKILMTTEGVDVSDFYIGSFGNKQTDVVGANLFEQICKKATSCIRKLSGTRAKEVQSHRFLENENVTIEAINKGALDNANKNCIDIDHVICPFDTVVNGYPTQPVMKQNFGTTTHENTQGFHLHRSLLINAENKEIIGVGHLNPWIRSVIDEPKIKNRLPEEKESFKWQNCVQNMILNVPNPKRLTFVGDRESDIFRLFKYITDQNRDFVIRAQYNRKLTNGSKIREYFASIEHCCYKTVELQRTRTRLKQRIATLEVKYSKIEIENTEKNGDSLELYCVTAFEIGDIPDGEERVSWILLTSHKITSDKKAFQILEWYTWRWIIEEIHRVMKKKGLQIESSQIQDPHKLLKLAMLLFASAVKIMTLVNARNGSNQLAINYFSESEILFLVMVCLSLEGKTEKLKNRYPKSTMGWAAWIIARLGGWKGYDSECPPGPITMKTGLERFQTMHEGWCFANPC